MTTTPTPAPADLSPMLTAAAQAIAYTRYTEAVDYPTWEDLDTTTRHDLTQAAWSSAVAALTAVYPPDATPTIVAAAWEAQACQTTRYRLAWLSARRRARHDNRTLARAVRFLRDQAAEYRDTDTITDDARASVLYDAALALDPTEYDALAPTPVTTTTPPAALDPNPRPIPTPPTPTPDPEPVVEPTPDPAPAIVEPDPVPTEPTPIPDPALDPTVLTDPAPAEAMP